jgi:hypothetical protein
MTAADIQAQLYSEVERRKNELGWEKGFDGLYEVDFWAVGINGARSWLFASGRTRFEEALAVSEEWDENESPWDREHRVAQLERTRS